MYGYREDHIPGSWAHEVFRPIVSFSFFFLLLLSSRLGLPGPARDAGRDPLAPVAAF